MTTAIGAPPRGVRVLGAAHSSCVARGRHMAGTYLQQDVYGDIPNVVPKFNKAMSDHQLVELIRSQPAVHAARKNCDWVVVTAIYQGSLAALRPPHTNSSECWLAFMDREEHVAPSWTKIPLVLFGSYERNENIFKVIMPAVLVQQRIVFVNHALPQARCLGLPHMVRGKELERGAADQPHLLASKIPGWSGRAVMPGQIEMTRGYLERRNSSKDVGAGRDLAELDEVLARMVHTGFNTSDRLPVVDTLWMIWPAPGNVTEKMSRLWLHEVARWSAYEKIAYPWVVSRVPEFKARLTDAIYIYSPTQRVCPGDTDSPSSNGSDGGGAGGRGKSKRRILNHSREAARRRLGRRMRIMSASP